MPAMRERIAKQLKAARPLRPPTPDGSAAPKAGPGEGPSDGALTSSSIPMSTPSGKPSRPSNKRWRKPRNVREFAAQANEIATLLLNDEIDIEKARGYASLARVVTQAASVEVTRSRFLRTAPDLSLE
jgi:hypothetical protein